MSIAVLWCTLTLTLVKTALAGDAVWDAHGHQGIVAHATKWMRPRETRVNLARLASGSSMPNMSMQPFSGARRQQHAGSAHMHGASKFRCRGWQPVALGVCASVECFEFRTCEACVLLKNTGSSCPRGNMCTVHTLAAIPNLIPGYYLESPHYTNNIR